MENTETLLLNDTVQHNKILPWIVCFSAALFFFYEFIQMNMFNAISLQLMETFSLNATQLGFLSANYFYSTLLFLLPAGLILDRVSTRKVILSSLFVCVLGTFCFALSSNYYLASFFRFLTGIGSAFCFLSCIRLASRWFPSNKMALVSGLIVTMAMSGGMVAQTPLTALVVTFGWREALLIDAAFGLIIFAVIFAVVSDYPSLQQREKRSIQTIGFFRSFVKSYFQLQNWLCGIYTSLMNLPVGIFGALWGITYLQQTHHFSAENASLITSMLFLGSILGAPLAGLLSDTLASRRIPMLIGTLLSLVCVVLIIKSPFYSVIFLGLLFFILGLATATQVISYPTVAESNPHSITATSVSVVSFCAISGYAISQPLFGKLMDWHWNGLIVNHQAIYSSANFDTALLILPIGFFIALCAAVLLRETNCRSSSQNE